jgi:L-lactate dehydrogenase complex protein LldE
MDQFAPGVAAKVAALLERLGQSWEYPEQQTCCGQFALSVGDLTTARRLMLQFLQVFGEADTVVCSSASCVWMVRHHYPALARHESELAALDALAGRVWELGEWLAARGELPWTPVFHGSLVLHRSCKARQLAVLPQARAVLSRVAGLDLLEVSPYYTCCGFGGVFSLQHPELSRAISQAYLEAVQATGAAGLVSLDYSCLLHLRGVAAARGLDLQFWHLAEILTASNP